MKIQKLTLDENDIKTAVQNYLATKGITIPVERVHQEYSGTDFGVDFVEDEKPKTPALPEIEPLPAVMTAAEMAEKLEAKPL